MLANPNSQPGIELQQAHVQLVMRVLGLDEEDLIRAFEPVASTKKPCNAANHVAYRRRVFLALREARVDGASLSLPEIACVTGIRSHNTVYEGALRADRESPLTESEINALRGGSAA